MAPPWPNSCRVFHLAVVRLRGKVWNSLLSTPSPTLAGSRTGIAPGLTARNCTARLAKSATNNELERRNMKKINVGTFEITSGKAYVSDPCYRIGTWCQGTVERVKTGLWSACIFAASDRCVARLLAFAEKQDCDARRVKWEEIRAEIGVDSGQCGVFDAAHYKKAASIKSVARIGPETICQEDPWYSICCDRTINPKHGAGVIPYGCVSSSGYGDGSYRGYVTRDKKGYVVGIKVEFITDEEDHD